MSDSIDKKIKKVSDRIAKEYQPEKIILFGSYAWGTPRQDSDLDFFIIKKTSDPMQKRMADVDRIFQRVEFPMDFLIYTPEQVERRKKMNDPFVINIMGKGKILYAK